MHITNVLGIVFMLTLSSKLKALTQGAQAWELIFVTNGEAHENEEISKRVQLLTCIWNTQVMSYTHF